MNIRKERLVITNCSMNRLPSVREETRDIDLVGAPERMLLPPYKLYRVTTVSVKGSYLQKT
jgi:hypothetical protein